MGRREASCLGRSPGTLSRESGRNSGLRWYRPRQAQRMSEQRRREACLLRQAHKSVKVSNAVWGWIMEWLQQALSPATGCGVFEAAQGSA